jgi:23S rRNA (guanosine2251-2'-O)-methyltransferase
VRISTRGAIGSLNVSNAAAIALHHAAWKRPQANPRSSQTKGGA